MTSAWYRSAFPRTRLDDTQQQTQTVLHTSRGGGRRATSVHGAMTGFGADIIILDDANKAEDAYSESALEEVNRWFRTTVSTRLNSQKTGRIVVVQHRLHEDDLPGHLLKNGDWHHLNLPAIAEQPAVIPCGDGHENHRQPGEVLHPEAQPREVLDAIQTTLGPTAFSAQYQQRPTPLEGSIIQWDWFQRYPHNLDTSKMCLVHSWDPALSLRDKASYSVGLCACLKDGNIYLVDMVRKQLDFPDLLDTVNAMSARANYVLIESAGAGLALCQQVKVRPDVKLVPIRPVQSKATRMMTATPLLKAGRVYLPPWSSPWRSALYEETQRFPYGEHDDIVDALSQLLNWVIALESRPKVSVAIHPLFADEDH